MAKEKKLVHLPYAGTKVRKIEYFGYATGMIGYQIQNTLMGIYLLMFMTTILKIPMLYAGSVTLVCRFVDAITDILFGTIGDRTHTQLGSFRPWYITMAIPACLAFMIMFMCPGFVTPGTSFALYWIYFIYLVYGSLFTTIMYTSYSAFTSVATADDGERKKLVLARQVGLNLSGIVVAAATPVMMYFGGGVTNSEAAFSALGIFVAIVSGICYLICGLSIRERVCLNAGKSMPIKESFKVFKGNKIFLGALICNVLHSIGIAMFGGMMSYYFLYYKMNPGLMSQSQLVAAIVATAVSLLVMPVMMRKLPRIGMYWIGVGVFSILMLIGYFAGMYAISGYLMCSAFTVGMMIVYAVTFSFIPDAVDYGEWRNGVAAPGMVNTVLSFIQKVTTGFGTMLTSVLLSAVGFEAANGFEQTEAAREGIRLVTCLVPSIFFCVSALGLIFLKVRADKMQEIRNELKERRAVAEEKVVEK